MAEPVKFTFDQAFDGGAKSRYDQEVDSLRAEIERVRVESHANGIQEGRTQALGEIEAATLEAMQQLGGAANNLFGQQNDIETRLRTEMVQLAYAISRKLSSSLMERYPLAEIENLILDCLATTQKEPRLVVRVAENIIDPINERIENMKASTGFMGEVILVGSATLGPHDCQIEWPDGGATRFSSEIHRDIEQAVQRFISDDPAERKLNLTDEQTDTTVIEEDIDPAVENAAMEA